MKAFTTLLGVIALLWLLVTCSRSCGSSKEDEAQSMEYYESAQAEDRSLSASPEVPLSPPQTKVKFAEFAKRSYGNMVDVYYSVSNFRQASKSDWLDMRQFAHYIAQTTPNLRTIHLMDNFIFTPPTDGGMYGGMAIMDKVIVQYVAVGNFSDRFLADPFGTGKYEEVQ